MKSALMLVLAIVLLSACDENRGETISQEVLDSISYSVNRASFGGWNYRGIHVYEAPTKVITVTYLTSRNQALRLSQPSKSKVAGVLVETTYSPGAREVLKSQCPSSSATVWGLLPTGWRIEIRGAFVDDDQKEKTFIGVTCQ